MYGQKVGQQIKAIKVLREAKMIYAVLDNPLNRKLYPDFVDVEGTDKQIFHKSIAKTVEIELEKYNDSYIRSSENTLLISIPQEPESGSGIFPAMASSRFYSVIEVLL